MSPPYSRRRPIENVPRTLHYFILLNLVYVFYSWSSSISITDFLRWIVYINSFANISWEPFRPLMQGHGSSCICPLPFPFQNFNQNNWTRFGISLPKLTSSPPAAALIPSLPHRTIQDTNQSPSDKHTEAHCTPSMVKIIKIINYPNIGPSPPLHHHTLHCTTLQW